MKRLAFVTGTLAALLMPASAADFSVKAPPHRDGWYIWSDASYQSIPLPTFDLGWRALNLGGTVDFGPINQHNVRLDGLGVGGGIGYRLPHGVLPALSNARIEIGGAFFRAYGETDASGRAPGTFSLVTLNGATITVITPSPFTATSTLNTQYQAWNVHATMAGDHQVGPVTLSPLLMLFGGTARVDQDFRQELASTFPAPAPAALYRAESSLRWTDVGVRLGGEARFAASKWLAFGLRGTVGTAHRSASLTASDACTDIQVSFCGGPPVRTSSISANAQTAPILASTEASISVQPSNYLVLGAFVGLNYDSQVPGLARPGPVTSPFVGTTTTPAGIKFESETSWYTGGRLTVHF